MIRLFWRFGLVVVAAAIFAWIADRPGTVTIRWLGREIETSFVAAVAFAFVLVIFIWFIWSLFRRLWRSPQAVGQYWRFRKNRRGYESLSKGIVAAGAGDAVAAARHAAIAGNALADEPLVNVLAAQAAQLKGDHHSVKRIFEAMTKSPETEALGRRGLFAEARLAGDMVAARAHAERALAINPRLAWASTAMLQLQSQGKNWAAAAATLAQQSKSGLLPAADASRKQAAMLAAEALALEEKNPTLALNTALRAHKLDPSLVPPALVAARIHIAQRWPRKAAKILKETWSRSPHPDLASVYAHAKPGEGPEARFERLRDLVKDGSSGVEGAYAVARAAAQAQRWDVARKSLEPHIENQPQARLCVLMSEIEEAQGDKGRAREWLARAVRAPRDPIWVSDGVASPRWTPVSPVSGEIVPCEWKAPFEMPEVTSPGPVETPGLQPLPRKIEKPRIVQQIRPPDDPGLAEDLGTPETAARKTLAADS